MKLRKSKSDIAFRIDFSIQTTKVVKHKNNVGGWGIRDFVWTPQTPVFAVGPNRGSVLRGFLYGRDRNNIRITRCVGQCHCA